MTFDSLNLIPEILKAVKAQGYETPTPIQAQAIPVVLEGRDLIAGAQTGTGKTAAFTLPLLQRLAPAANTSPLAAKHPIRALILTPTRELALQVEESVRLYGADLPLRSTAIFGGVNIKPQIKALRSGVEIVVATPGRLLDHQQQGTLNFSQLEVLILDEADRMLDMGFIRDIKKILALLPAKRQNLMFSATFEKEIRELAGSMLKDPATIDVAPRNSGAELVRHTIHPVDRVRKVDLLTHLIQTQSLQQVLVFTRTKHMANSVADHLNREGIPSAAIHGNKSQYKRTQALSDFKGYKIQVLVATDIAARGLDIDQLPHVVNYELPHVPEDYVHRSGRTGRAGSEGDALSLVCVDEIKLLRDIEKLMKKTLPLIQIPGFEPDPRIKAEPIINGRSGGGGRSGGRPSGPSRHPSPKAPQRHQSHHKSPGQNPRSSSSGYHQNRG